MRRIASLFWLLVGLGVSDGFWGEVTDWEIITKTGDKEHADSNAGVYIILIDANGQNSEPTELDETFVNDFERGDINFFLFHNSVDFKDVCAIRIFHDNNGDSPGCYLEWVKVKSEKMLKSRTFIVNRWVPTDLEEWRNNFVVQRTPPCSAGHLP